MAPVEGLAPQAHLEKIKQAQEIVRTLFVKHSITDPNQASRIIREEFSQFEYEMYKTARDYLDSQAVNG